MLEVVPDRVGLLQERGKRLGAMEGEHRPRAVLDVVVVREPDELVRRLVGEADAMVALDPLERAVRIAGGLPLDGRDVLARLGLLRLDDADGRAIHEQGIVDGTGVRGKLPDGDAAGGRQVQGPEVLDRPAGFRQLPVDDKA